MPFILKTAVFLDVLKKDDILCLFLLHTFYGDAA